MARARRQRRSAGADCGRRGRGSGYCATARARRRGAAAGRLRRGVPAGTRKLGRGRGATGFPGDRRRSLRRRGRGRLRAGDEQGRSQTDFRGGGHSGRAVHGRAAGQLAARSARCPARSRLAGLSAVRQARLRRLEHRRDPRRIARRVGRRLPGGVRLRSHRVGRDGDARRAGDRVRDTRQQPAARLGARGNPHAAQLLRLRRQVRRPGD